MGLLEEIARKTFLGEEFLTWLWYLSETAGGPIEVRGCGSCRIAMGQEMVLGNAEGGDVQTVVLRGEMPSASAEAREALGAGKKLKRAKIYLTLDGVQWSFALTGATLAISGLRVPSAAGLDFDSRCLERLGAMERVSGAVYGLFEQFLELRVESDRWEELIGRMRKWAKKPARGGRGADASR